MRIAWTGPIGEGGGVPGMGRLMVIELLRQGVEVDVYRPQYDFEESPIEPMPGLRMVERHSDWAWDRWYSRSSVGAMFTGLASRTLSHLILNVKLLREHRRRPYDAIYQLSTTELFLLGYLRKLLPPIVVHPCTHAAGELRWHQVERDYALQAEPRLTHELIGRWLKIRSRVQPNALAQSDLVLGLSDRFNELIRLDYNVAENKLGVVRTPVDLERFTTDGLTEKFDKHTLLFVSRISTRKGVEEIIQLSHRLSDLSDSVRLLVIGGPTQWSDYTAHLRRLNPDVAEYLGAVPSDRLPAMMRAATMLLVPSRYEPGSITAAEALACGLPVVLSDEVGAAEVVSGPHARRHAPQDVQGLEEAVRSLLSAMRVDEALLRASARRNAEEQFAPETVVARLIEWLESAREGSRSSGRSNMVRRDRAAELL